MKDLSGGWPQLAHKLGINDLEFRGGKIPKNKKAVSEAISDIHQACIDEGATELTMPTKPLTYTSLILKLKDLGLVTPSGNGGDAPPPPPPPAAQQQQDDVDAQVRVDQIEEAAILANHHNEVNLLFL